MAQNVFILTADSLNYPYFDEAASRIADLVNGVEFTTAVAPSNETSSSMPALATGKYADAFPGHAIPDSGPPYPLLELLAADEYETGLWTDNYLFGEEYNYDRGVNGGNLGTPTKKKKLAQSVKNSSLGRFFNFFEWGYFNIIQPSLDQFSGYSPFYQSAEKLHQEVLAWLDDAPQPLAIWIHYMDTHHPFEPPEEYLADVSFSKSRSRSEVGELSRNLIKANGVGYTDNEYADVEAAYRASCRYLEDTIFSFLSDLIERGYFRPSRDVFVFSADHGESLQRGREMVGHTPVAFWEDILRVPLVIGRPDWPSATVDHQVSLVDFMPTVLDAVGTDIPADLDGRTAVTPEELHREVVLAIQRSGVQGGAKSYRAARTETGHKIFVRYDETVYRTHVSDDNGSGETVLETFDAWENIQPDDLDEEGTAAYTALADRGGGFQHYREDSEGRQALEEHLANLGYK